MVSKQEQSNKVLSILQFQIVCREPGLDGLSSSALVTVNLVDANDNPPVFEKSKYSAVVHENEANGKVILKVSLTELHWRIDLSIPCPSR